MAENYERGDGVLESGRGESFTDVTAEIKPKQVHRES
jgi:hypothetical protein